MTEVLHSPSHFPSSPASTTFFHGQTQPYNPNPNPASSSPAVPVEARQGTRGGDGVGCGGEGGSERTELKSRKDKEREDLSLLTLLVAVFRKSLVACKASTTDDLSAMDIGWPTNVRHVAHVTFDRFNGFLGLPVEFEPEVPMRAPSASTSVFGVSTESMQLSYDSRGNCVPTILVLMQRRLYAQGGLQAEGIFRINAENSQEEFVRDQLNRGIIPDDIDVHCLAGLIKAWFRELPTGVLDTLSPEQVMQCETEEDCTELVRLLPATEASLLDWAINLMADVVQQEQFNKMNAHNIAMVFAPNMTQMVDPLTALMFAVQVMNFLKTLIMKTLQEREELQIGLGPTPCLGPSDDSGHQSPSQPPIFLADNISNGDNDDVEHYSTDDEDEPAFDSSHDSTPLGDSSDSSPFQWVPSSSEESRTVFEGHMGEGEEKHSPGQLASLNGVLDTLSPEKEFVNECGELLRSVTAPVEKCKAVSNLSRISSRTGLTEAWR